MKPDNPEDVPIVKGLFGTITAGLGIGGAVLLVLGLKRRGRRFKSGVHWMLYDDGLVVVSDGKPRAYRWEDLEVWLQVVVTQVAIGTHHEYVLKAVDKRKPIPFPLKRWNLRKVDGDTPGAAGGRPAAGIARADPGRRHGAVRRHRRVADRDRDRRARPGRGTR